ncbi:MAG: hypothetical protein LC808_01720 [Actinobacteria bacterium]|nr:hypothetical protein [Actinomycetota bacterium]
MRFHAAQSLWVDISAVVYFVISMILIAVYVAIRYPEPHPQIAPDDPVMWTWALTALVGPPVIHVILAILTMTGRNPRIPLVWKIAATIATRQKERAAHQEGRLASDEEPHPINSPRWNKPPPLSEKSTATDDSSAKAREHHAPNYTPRQTDDNNYEHTKQSRIQALQNTSTPQHTEEIVQLTGRDPEWNPFRTGRGNDERSHVAFTSYKWLYGILAILVLIFSLLLIVGIFASTSLGGKIIYSVLAVFLIFIAIGFVGIVKSPIRLEISSRGIQLFARSGTTWLPWEVVETVTIKRIGGVFHVVAWLPYSDVFPQFDSWGGGPRYIPKINAIAVCSLSVLRAPRHQVVRALRTYAGSKFIGISS